MASKNPSEKVGIFDTPQFEKFTAAVEVELARLGRSRQAKNQKITIKHLAEIYTTKKSGVYAYLGSEKAIVGAKQFETWKKQELFSEVMANVIQLYQEWQTISDAMLMTQRRQEWKDKSYQMAEKLMAKADEMLNAPLFKQKSEMRNGEKVIILAPKWNVASSANLLAQADKLAREALGMADKTVDVSSSESLTINIVYEENDKDD